MWSAIIGLRSCRKTVAIVVLQNLYVAVNAPKSVHGLIFLPERRFGKNRNTCFS